MTKPTGILAMNPEEYREIDGVVFDQRSYARHCGTQNPSPAPTQPVEPSPESVPSAIAAPSVSPFVSSSPAENPPPPSPPVDKPNPVGQPTPSTPAPSSPPAPAPTRPSYQKPLGILAMNPGKYREMDGVVFDLEHYARHCQTAPSASTSFVSASPGTPDNPGPAPVFAVDPYPVGWYEADGEHPPIPIMGGALPPAGMVLQEVENGIAVFCQTVWVTHGGSGSGSGSYLTSYVTSYRTSWVTSGSFGSFGSFGSDAVLGWYECGSLVFPVRGYGLELV